jgi:hypothetical protein
LGEGGVEGEEEVVLGETGEEKVIRRGKERLVCVLVTVAL